MEPDGTSQTPVVATGADETSPAWSPDGSKIAFTSAGEIWTVNPDGSGAAKLTDGTDPTWSPNGEIAFVRLVNGSYDVLKMNADGTGSATNLTENSAAHDADPHWSADGSKIVFSTDRGGSFDLYALNPSSAKPEASSVVATAAWESFGAWSADSASLAYQLSAGGAFDIWTLSGGGAADNLTETRAQDEQGATWSPDGGRIAFARNNAGFDIWTMNPDGSGQTQLTSDGRSSTPDWQVAPPIIAPPPPPVAEPARRQLKLADLTAPELGKEVNVETQSGIVYVAVAGGTTARSGARASQKGLRFVPLTEARQIPTGSFLDTRKGTVRLQSSVNARGTAQFGSFGSGLIQVLQSRRRSARGLTDLILKGSSFSRCRSARRGKRATAAASIRRRLRANARGRFRTRGRHSAATVRGTVWLTADRCDGTLTKVTRGKVAVRDFRRKKTVLVRAGKSYLAKAQR